MAVLYTFHPGIRREKRAHVASVRSRRKKQTRSPEGPTLVGKGRPLENQHLKPLLHVNLGVPSSPDI